MVRYRWLIGLVISSVAILLASIQFIGHDDGAVVYLDIETRVELSTTICTPTQKLSALPSLIEQPDLGFSDGVLAQMHLRNFHACH